MQQGKQYSTSRQVELADAARHRHGAFRPLLPALDDLSPVPTGGPGSPCTHSCVDRRPDRLRQHGGAEVSLLAAHLCLGTCNSFLHNCSSATGPRRPGPSITDAACTTPPTECCDQATFNPAPPLPAAVRPSCCQKPAPTPASHSCGSASASLARCLVAALCTQASTQVRRKVTLVHAGEGKGQWVFTMGEARACIGFTLGAGKGNGCLAWEGQGAAGVCLGARKGQ